MSDNDEMAEIERQLVAVVSGVVRAATELAQTLIRMRAEELRRAAAAGQQQARETRARVRAWQRADAVVWRAVHRPEWWARAGAEDIAQVWRAAATWATVDPRADEARRILVERLADRGVRVRDDVRARPEDAVWLSEALDRAAAHGRPEAGQADEGRPAPTAGQTSPDPAASAWDEARQARRDEASERQERMAERVRSVWAPERAERVVGDEAWPVLAGLLDRLSSDGQDVRELLDRVPSFVDRARSPAAFAFRVIDDPMRDSDEARERIRARAVAARLDERDQHVIEADWWDSAVPAGQRRAADVQFAEDDADRAASYEAEAARVAAQGYPATTADAVSAAAAGDSKRVSGTGGVAVRGRPSPQRARRDPQSR